LVQTARRTGKLLGIAYQRSYLPEYLLVRNKIQAGELGKVRFMTVHLEQGWLAGRLAKGRDGDWRSDPRQAGGGQLVDTGSHTLAALLYVTELVPVQVFAYVDNAGLDVDVNTAMVVRFANGALASITIGGFGHSVTECLRIVGDQASARIFFRTVREQSLEIDGQVVDASAHVERSTPNANFVEAILGRASIGADGELGLRVAQLTEAAYESAKRGAPVHLA
jgi:predicted dehydrogenase